MVFSWEYGKLRTITLIIIIFYLIYLNYDIKNSYDYVTKHYKIYRTMTIGNVILLRRLICSRTKTFTISKE